ncbi:Cytochrome c [Cupriavidus sp. H18C2]
MVDAPEAGSLMRRDTIQTTMRGLLALLAMPLAAHAAPADPAAQVAQVAQGRYLARIANCVACHTAPGGAPMAGGLALQTDAGTIYSTNITPDPETGLGRYTLDDFDRAVRHGQARDGKRLYPAMPYPSYARMTRDDVAALYTWLRSEVQPVRQANRDTSLRWPYGMRWLLVPWNWLHLRDDPVRADAGQGETWRRGAYLVQAVAHCGACHTPRGALYGEKGRDAGSRQFLSGAMVEGWSATNLTGDMLTGLGAWSKADVVEYLHTGRNAHATSFGPMSTVIATSTQFMNAADLDAVATYLKSIPPARGETQPYRYDPAAAARLEQGRFDTPGARQYATYCMPCHQASGKGFARVFPPLAGNPTVVDPNPASLVNLLLEGAVTARVQTAPTDYHMPGYGWTMEDQELANLLTFIRRSWGNQAAPVTEEAVAARRRALGLRAPETP